MINIKTGGGCYFNSGLDTPLGPRIQPVAGHTGGYLHKPSEKPPVVVYKQRRKPVQEKRS